MHTATTPFARLMDSLQRKTFHRIVARCDGESYVKFMTCADQFDVMAFAQVTYRDSMRDSEACLSAQTAKLYHMDLPEDIKRSTLADANTARDWRIHTEFSQHLIGQAREIYTCDSLGIEFQNTTYTLDSRTHRSVPFAFSVGVVSYHQVGGEEHTLIDVQILDVLVLETGAIY